MTEMTNTHTQREVGIRQPGASDGNAEPPPLPPNKHSMFIIYSGAGRQALLHTESRRQGLWYTVESRRQV